MIRSPDASNDGSVTMSNCVILIKCNYSNDDIIGLPV